MSEDARPPGDADGTDRRVTAGPGSSVIEAGRAARRPPEGPAEGPGQPGDFVSPRLRAGLLAAGREATAVAVGGILAGLMWLAAVMEGRRFDLTEADFARAIALEFGAEGISRQEVGVRGLEVSIVLGIVIMALYATALWLTPGLRARSWSIQAIPLALIVFIAWGAVFSPARPSGFFGLDAGGTSSVTIHAVGAVLFAVLGMRAYSLVRTADWWRVKQNSLDRELDDLIAQRESLELAEEKPEKADVRSDG